MKLVTYKGNDETLIVNENKESELLEEWFGLRCDDRHIEDYTRKKFHPTDLNREYCLIKGDGAE